MKRDVNKIYDEFVRQVARGRRKSAYQVEAQFGKGRMIRADKAIGLGMVDRIVKSTSLVPGA